MIQSEIITKGPRKNTCKYSLYYNSVFVRICGSAHIGEVYCAIYSGGDNLHGYHSHRQLYVQQAAHTKKNFNNSINSSYTDYIGIVFVQSDISLCVFFAELRFGNSGNVI